MKVPKFNMKHTWQLNYSLPPCESAKTHVNKVMQAVEVSVLRVWKGATYKYLYMAQMALYWHIYDADTCLEYGLMHDVKKKPLTFFLFAFMTFKLVQNLFYSGRLLCSVIIDCV